MNDEKIKKASFIEHLTELRSRLLKSIVYLFIFFVISYIFAENIYGFLVEPYADAVKDDNINRRLIYTALHETFVTYLKVAFFTAFLLLVQLYSFKYGNLWLPVYIQMRKKLYYHI